MKYKMILTLLGLFLCVGSFHAHAALSVDEKMKELKRNLVLSDDQVKDIRPIIVEYKNAVDRAKEIKTSKLKRVLSMQQMQMLEKLDEENEQGSLPK